MDQALRQTRAGSLLGTPCYMSPEQARGRSEADVRSALMTYTAPWSSGALMTYKLLGPRSTHDLSSLGMRA